MERRDQEHSSSRGRHPWHGGEGKDRDCSYSFPRPRTIRSAVKDSDTTVYELGGPQRDGTEAWGQR